MATVLKNDLVEVEQYITDKKGHKIFAVIEMEELKRIKELLKVIPKQERWLYENKEALGSVQKGLKEISKGKMSKFELNDL